MRRKRSYLILPVEPAASVARADEASQSLDAIAWSAFSRTRRELIAEAAYERALVRAFRGGDPVQDWLSAEIEIDTRLERKRRRGDYTAAARRVSVERSQT